MSLVQKLLCVVFTFHSIQCEQSLHSQHNAQADRIFTHPKLTALTTSPANLANMNTDDVLRDTRWSWGGRVCRKGADGISLAPNARHHVGQWGVLAARAAFLLLKHRQRVC